MVSALPKRRDREELAHVTSCLCAHVLCYQSVGTAGYLVDELDVVYKVTVVVRVSK